jgi:hypothetical protein
MARTKKSDAPEEAQLIPDPKPMSPLVEWLATYGWAVLVVLAAIGALVYFGVFSPDKLLPQSNNQSVSCCEMFCKQVSNGEMSCQTMSEIGMNGKITCKAPVKGSTASVLFTFDVPNRSEFCP